jgi:predicted extracellular nuclease
VPFFRSSRKRLLAGLVTLAAALPLVVSVSSAAAAPTDLFFSEYIEGTSNNKALEIFNGTGAPMDLATEGYNVQMFFNGNGTAGLTINLTGTVANDDVFVLAHSSASATILAEADQTNGASWFNGDDAVVLRKGTTVLDVIGQVGFDPGSEWGAGVTSTADNTLRRKTAIQAGDANGGDAFDPAAEWDGFATDTFGGLGTHDVNPGDAAPSVAGTTPASGAANVELDSDLTVVFSEPVDVTGDWFTLVCDTSGSHTASVSGGPTTFTLDPDAPFALEESCTLTVVAAEVADQDADDPPDTMAQDFVASFTTVGPPTRINEIQGAAHRSPLEGETVSGVAGIVTAKLGNGFYLQDPVSDADPATSEAVFVFTSSSPTSVVVGDALEVGGRVSEFRPGGSSGTNLTTTEIVSPSISVVSTGNPLPSPTAIGVAGRVPPDTVIEDDATGSVETSGEFDPASDGIDFYESLEAMRVEIDDAVAVGPTNAFGEIPVVGDDGASAGIRTVRGGVVIRPEDFNPERIQLDDTILATPEVNVGDHFDGPAVGVLDYSFGNFKLNITTRLARVDGGLVREVTRAPHDQEIVVGTYNVENLDPGDGDAFARHADLIVNHLSSPDVLAVEEVQDNDGATDDGVTDASVTWNLLVAAIEAAGGPHYEYRQIDPVDDADGGEPGGNIRVGFLFRTDRGVSFIDRPGGSSTAATHVVDHPSGPRLTLSPGRVEPQNAAWEDSRKPLAGEFRMHGKKVFVIANHFASKGGDDPLFGRFQPTVRSSEIQRHAQAQVVHDFVGDLLAADRDANVIVLGDINDFEFSETVDILGAGRSLTSLMETLPKAERYSYDFEGNSQVLDQVLVSPNLLASFPVDYDPVHVNSEFFDQTSDHDPQVARIDFRGRGTPK